MGIRHTFIGCTGSGIPKAIPVKIFHKPEKTNVVDNDMELLTARAIISGSRVPRSPSDPEISDKGELRKVATLLAWRRRNCAKVIVVSKRCEPLKRLIR